MPTVRDFLAVKASFGQARRIGLVPPSVTKRWETSSQAIEVAVCATKGIGPLEFSSLDPKTRLSGKSAVEFESLRRWLKRHRHFEDL